MRFPLSFLPAVAIVLIAVVAGTSGQALRRNAVEEDFVVKRYLQRLSITDIFWTMIRGGCIFRGFFTEGRRYPQMMARSQYTNVRLTGEEALSQMRVNKEGPAMLRGMFWLNIEGEWTEAMSFARTEEGGGLSTGTWNEDNNPAYRIRLMGDGTWAGGLSPEFLNVMTDPISSFVVEQGTIQNPEKIRISIDFVFPFTCNRLSSGSDCLTPAVDWTMTLQNTPVTIDDGRDPHPVYKDSIVWRRDSEGVFSVSYEAIQVVDEQGNRLSPASDDFVKDIDESTEGGTIMAGFLNPDASASTFCSSGYWWCFWC